MKRERYCQRCQILLRPNNRDWVQPDDYCTPCADFLFSVAMDAQVEAAHENDFRDDDSDAA